MSPSSTRSSSAADPATAGVPLFDTQRQYAGLQAELEAAVIRVCRSGRWVLGPDCQELEASIAAYCGAPHAVACASGSDALLLALMACDIGAGDEVILPSYTFFATASAIWRLGATPVFVDIDPVTFNLDPRQLISRVTPATRALVPVHLYGLCADMQPILEVARQHGLTVIEDAAQAIGAGYRGQRAGVLGDMAALSFYPTKNLGGMGDGGMLTTTRADLYDRLRVLHVHGMRQRYYHEVVGVNSRLDSIQAATLNVKLPYLGRWTAARRRHAQRYAELFERTGLDQILGLPREPAGYEHVWNQYVVRVPDGRRDALRQHLMQHKVGSEIYYPIPLHRQECFRSLNWEEGSLPETERAARETLALPVFPELSEAEQLFVVSQIASFFGVGRGGHELRGPKFLSQSAKNPAEQDRVS